MRRDLRKLLVRQPEKIPIHQRFLSEAVNHNTSPIPTILWVWTLSPRSHFQKVEFFYGHPGSERGDGFASSNYLARVAKGGKWSLPTFFIKKEPVGPSVFVGDTKRAA